MSLIRLLLLTASIFMIHACGHKEEKIQPAIETIPGGKGGKFHIALFPVTGKKGVSGNCYIRYGCKDIPPSPITYDDSSTTMVEPGYGPHTHFNDLQSGFYLLSAKCNYNGKTVMGDTIIEIRESQAVASDCYLQVK